jgi:hypothetical protein
MPDAGVPVAARPFDLTGELVRGEGREQRPRTFRTAQSARDSFRTARSLSYPEWLLAIGAPRVADRRPSVVGR